METERKKLIIIDSNSVVHRAFHALPPLATKKREIVNAVYGFLLVLFRAVKEFEPDFIVACFDFPAPTFRHKKFKKYKAKRPAAPKELYSQIPKIKKVLDAFGVPVLEKEGFEADDIIATVSKVFSRKQVFPPLEKVIVSGDLDSLQLVDGNTKVFLLKKGVKNTLLYDEDLVKERYSGLAAKQLVDFRALRGDPSDNIPGVGGIGEKTAIELLGKFKTLENLYKEAEKKNPKDLKPRIKELLLSQKEQAFLSKELAETSLNVPVEINIKKSRWGDYDKEDIVGIFNDFEFYSLIKRIPECKKKCLERENNLTLW